MNAKAAAPLLIAAAVAASSPAWAVGGWDWDEELTSRHWRYATLDRAQDIHPDHPSFDDLVAYYTPPAHEMWCHYSEAPTSTDLQVWGNLRDQWIRDLLVIPPGGAIPSSVPPQPRECVP